MGPHFTLKFVDTSLEFSTIFSKRHMIWNHKSCFPEEEKTLGGFGNIPFHNLFVIRCFVLPGKLVETGLRLSTKYLAIDMFCSGVRLLHNSILIKYLVEVEVLFCIKKMPQFCQHVLEDEKIVLFGDTSTF